MMVLLISPHADDWELGAGGTAIKLKERGLDISTMVFTDNDKLKYEAIKSSISMDFPIRIYHIEGRRYNERRQDILQWLYDYNMNFSPDIVFVPCTYDKHQDHQVITNEAIRAFPKSTIYGYIHPWDCRYIPVDCIVPLDKHHIETKVDLIKKYRSKPKYYTNPEQVWSLARGNGLFCGSEYAEIFEVIRKYDI